jgi:hypothetical protein
MKPRLDAKQTNENEAFDLDIVECLDSNLTYYLANEFENEFKYPLRSLVFFPRNKVKIIFFLSQDFFATFF